MALKETKTITVDPEDEDETRTLWESFGWELENKETVRTSDSSHLERSGDSIYNVTKRGVHYVKMTFRRDPERKNYAELVELEKQYYVPLPEYNFDDEPDEVDDNDRPKFGKGWIFLIVVGMFFYVIPGIIILILRYIYFSKQLKSWTQKKEAYEAWENGDHVQSEAEKAYDEAWAKRNAVLEKAKSLV